MADEDSADGCLSDDRSYGPGGGSPPEFADADDDETSGYDDGSDFFDTSSHINENSEEEESEFELANVHETSDEDEDDDMDEDEDDDTDEEAEVLVSRSSGKARKGKGEEMLETAEQITGNLFPGLALPDALTTMKMICSEVRHHDVELSLADLLSETHLSSLPPHEQVATKVHLDELYDTHGENEKYLSDERKMLEKLFIGDTTPVLKKQKKRDENEDSDDEDKVNDRAPIDVDGSEAETVKQIYEMMVCENKDLIFGDSRDDDLVHIEKVLRGEELKENVDTKWWDALDMVMEENGIIGLQCI